MKPSSKTQFIKERLPLVEYARSVGLKLEGEKTRYQVSCCFHQEKDPSLSFYYNKNKGEWLFHCHGCGKGGDVINFYQYLNNVSNREAIKALDEIASGHSHSYSSTGFKRFFAPLSLKPEIAKPDRPPVKIYQTLLDTCGLSDEARAYLHGRLLTDESIEKYKIRSITDYKETVGILKAQFSKEELEEASVIKGGQFTFIRNTIIIPHIVDGEVVGLRGRYFYNNSAAVPEDGRSKKYKGTKYATRQLYNIDLLKTLDPFSDTVYLCEGEFDSILLNQKGKHSVSLPNGVGSVKDYDVEILRPLFEFETILSFDDDIAGAHSTGLAIEVFKKHTGRLPKILDLKGSKDVTDYYLKNTAQ